MSFFTNKNEKDDGRINPKSKGKKLLDRAQSSERTISVAESMQALNPMTKGKKFVSPRASPNHNWFDLPAEEVVFLLIKLFILLANKLQRKKRIFIQNLCKSGSALMT